MQPVFACRLSFARAPWASGWRAGDAALSAQRRVPDGVRPRVTREVRSGCVAVSLAECLVLWFCVSLLCDRHRPSCVHPYRVGVPVVGRTVFRLPINQSIIRCRKQRPGRRTQQELRQDLVLLGRRQALSQVSGEPARLTRLPNIVLHERKHFFVHVQTRERAVSCEPSLPVLQTPFST